MLIGNLFKMQIICANQKGYRFIPILTNLRYAKNRHTAMYNLFMNNSNVIQCICIQAQFNTFKGHGHDFWLKFIFLPCLVIRHFKWSIKIWVQNTEVTILCYMYVKKAHAMFLLTLINKLVKSLLHADVFYLPIRFPHKYTLTRVCHIHFW